jgi:hypothetical protein
MGRREDLQSLLEDLLGSENVYFQPPTNVQMSYPCITYKRDGIRPAFADNAPYRLTTRYLVTLLTEDPDNEVVEKIAALPMCSHNRFFTKDRLNHDVFALHY